MGESEIEYISEIEAAEKIVALEHILGDRYTKDIGHLGRAPVITYDEQEYKSSPDALIPDRKRIKLLFEGNAAAIVDLNTRSANPLLRIYFSIPGGVKLIEPVAEDPSTDLTEEFLSTSPDAIREFINRKLPGVPVKRSIRYQEKPPTRSTATAGRPHS